MDTTDRITTIQAAEIDYQIEKARKQFYTLLMAKKRNIRRIWLEMNAVANEHLLETLPYRAMLNQETMEIPSSHDASIGEKADPPHIIISTMSDLGIKNRKDNDDVGVGDEVTTKPGGGWEDDLDFETDLEIQAILSNSKKLNPSQQNEESRKSDSDTSSQSLLD